MTLEQYIEALENPPCEIEIPFSELLGFLKELKDARMLIEHQAQYIECHIDRS